MTEPDSDRCGGVSSRVSRKHFPTIKGGWCCFKLLPCKLQNSQRLLCFGPPACFSCFSPAGQRGLPSVAKGSTAVSPSDHAKPSPSIAPGDSGGACLSAVSLRLAQPRVTLPYASGDPSSSDCPGAHLTVLLCG